MRIAALVAVSALVAACSQSVGGQAELSASRIAPPTGATAGTSTATSPPTRPPTGAPAPGAPIDEVISWVEAGTSADPEAHHVAFRDGVTTRLGDEIAFTAPSGAADSTTQCITDARLAEGTLTCLLDFADPPPRPADGEGQWKPGWVEYSGTDVQVGSLRGDPGPFVNGSGPELAGGQSLAFGDDRCRSDAAGLLCVNYAHRSAIWISADGVVPFGCLQQVAPPPATGATFRC